MKCTVYVAGVASVGLVAGFGAMTVVSKAMLLTGLQDSTGHPSLSTAFGLLAFWVCIVAGEMSGYRLSAQPPDPAELGRARRYFDWLCRYRPFFRTEGRP